MSDYKVLTHSDAKLWSEYFFRLPNCQQDIYFTPEYYKLYEDYGDGIAHCFIYEKDGDIALYPFLKNSVNEIGYILDDQYYDIQGAYGYNGIVSTTDKEHFINSFYLAFDDYHAKSNIIAEFTRFHPLLENYKFSQERMSVFFDRKTVFVDLKNSYESILHDFQKTTRKQLKRCHHKHNLEVEIIENDISQIEVFYSIYTEAMARVQSIEYLYFNIEYFRKLISTTKSALFIAKQECKPIAAIIAFYNDYYIHGHLGGALTDFLNTSSYSLLYSEIIKFGKEKGCKYFHVGGGATNEIDDKLLLFKLNFSDTTADFYIGKKIHNQLIYDNVIKQWENKFPEKTDLFKNRILKYRF